MVALIFMFIVVGLPVIIIHAVAKHRGGSLTFTLEHASVTGFNLTSDGHLTSFFDVSIQANHTNFKKKLKYSGIRVSIFKNKQNLAENSLDKFTQRKWNVTMLRSESVALSVRLKQSPEFDLRFESGLGYIDFDVFMTATLNGDNLEVNCKHAIVNITAAPYDVAASPSTANSHGKFRSVLCSAYIYSNDNGP